MENSAHERVQKKLDALPTVYFKPSFDAVLDLISHDSAELSCPVLGIVNEEIGLIKNQPGWEVEFNKAQPLLHVNQAHITIGKNQFSLSGLKVHSSKAKHFQDEDGQKISEQVSFGSISEMSPISGDTDLSFRRAIFPLLKNTRLPDYFQDEVFKNESMETSRGSLKVNINEKELIIYDLKYDGSNFFVIDTSGALLLEDFRECCYSILIGYSFFSVELHQNEAFYLSSTDSEFRTITSISYRALRDSIIASNRWYPLIWTAAAVTEDRDLIETIQSNLTLCSSQNFSNLCTKVHINRDFKVTILLLLEASNSSLVLRPAGFSVALERLANIIGEENDDFKPIPSENKELADSFRTHLSQVLEQMTCAIKTVGHDKSITMLEKNIAKINNAPNMDRLKGPFELFGLKLNKEDKAALNHRNDFLHGRDIKGEDEADAEALRICLRLSKLINRLILKYIGFSGYTVNHIKRYEDVFAYEIKEELFERI